jgi:predicted nuclease of predicted toxin-antitoxin system
MNIVVDMNLAPEISDLLTKYGWRAVHWSSVGNPRATDAELMNWALDNGYVVLTHDLDFGTILALTRAKGPSVIQLLTQDVSPSRLVPLLLPIFVANQTALEAGALVVVDEVRSRVRMLPLTS